MAKLIYNWKKFNVEMIDLIEEYQLLTKIKEVIIDSEIEKQIGFRINNLLKKIRAIQLEKIVIDNE